MVYVPGQRVTVIITNSEHIPRGNILSPYLYTLKVTHANHEWEIKRRYQDFQKLHSRLQLFKARLKLPKANNGNTGRGPTVVPELPSFPHKPDAFMNSEQSKARMEELENYLFNILKHSAYRNHKALLRFLEVSRMSFIACSGSTKRKEGTVAKKAAGLSQGLFGSQHWGERWFIVKDSYITYLRKDGSVGGVMLMDRGFHITREDNSSLALHGLKIINLSRQMLVNCGTGRQADQWEASITAAAESTGKEFIMMNRFDSFAPVREGYAQWLVDGAAYMRCVSTALDLAKEEIFICSWWLSPEVFLRRPIMTLDDPHRLDHVLLRKAEEGVRVYILLYKEDEQFCSGINSFYVKQSLLRTQTDNIKILRVSDQDSYLWTHHEKLVVVDQRIAFLGGMDLCFGRWDDKLHRLTDPGSTVLARALNSPSRFMADSGAMDLIEVLKNKENEVDKKMEGEGTQGDKVDVQMEHTGEEEEEQERQGDVDSSDSGNASPDSNKRSDNEASQQSDSRNENEQENGSSSSQQNDSEVNDDKDSEETPNSSQTNNRNDQEPSNDAGNGVSKQSDEKNKKPKLSKDKTDAAKQTENGKPKKSASSKHSCTNSTAESDHQQLPLVEELPNMKLTMLGLSADGILHNKAAKQNTGSKVSDKNKLLYQDLKDEDSELRESVSQGKRYSAGYDTNCPSYEITGKCWVGKDYANFVIKDWTELEQPFIDTVDRLTVPRIPWHDVGCVVYGKAARDTARHFIQRWNHAKYLRCKQNPVYPYLVPKSYDWVPIPEPLKATSLSCKCQVLRSASRWSSGMEMTESSIQNAYIHAIRTAKHYIYIESQYLISRCGDKSEVSNGICDALYGRIMEAHRNQESFRVYILLPLVPGFEGEYTADVPTGNQIMSYWLYTSVCRGEKSLLGKLQQDVEDPLKYLSVCSMRSHSELGGKLITEIIYIHSKLLIVDDTTVIIGSANINDRSMLGDLDSEVSMIFEDTETVESRMDGEVFQAGKFAQSLRINLFREHLGYVEDDNSKLLDPVIDSFYRGTWIKQATLNTATYERVFKCLPSDQVQSYAELEQYCAKNPMSESSPSLARGLLKKVKGHLVCWPMGFLQEEMLLPSLDSKEAALPSVMWT
ncbi:phospholipase D2-like [Lingula anatina]|uniref:Phospholipase n=1 Tax=Lingula anatina TaxID=7574 RepID=A0A1S3JUV6_LINAN|nr:phospholipase D2-like [Lingula anatina]|eukprot:XP_013413874.1 phospholipase D2-like [Lingula anatina]